MSILKKYVQFVRKAFIWLENWTRRALMKKGIIWSSINCIKMSSYYPNIQKIFLSIWFSQFFCYIFHRFNFWAALVLGTGFVLDRTRFFASSARATQFWFTGQLFCDRIFFRFFLYFSLVGSLSSDRGSFSAASARHTKW